MDKNNSVPRNSLQNRHIRELPVKIVMTILLSIIAVMMVVPFIWMLSASFKYERDVMKIPIQWIPENPTWDNYKEILHINTKSKDYHFLLAYWNSIKVLVTSTFCSVASAALAGYAFAKLNFRGAKVLFLIYLAQLMVPTQLTLIPRFLMFSELEMVNTHWSVILPKVVSVSSTFLVQQAFISTPSELREAAKIDGAGEFHIWWRIMLPLVKPTLAAVATVGFLACWNEYLDPLVFLSDWGREHCL